ncbi:hypothetical protein H0266_13175 [Halobacillus locisalis]|uniref:Uncharacterized protein n=1 Tax=Halobacillus locisalis TaxID=220753 RepID=A0A838CVB4_9BACI|nr:hypothetical protein [Halobacillus locisalis]MBA2175843.1 hypothetical protein [Halobacillus locisalis]
MNMIQWFDWITPTNPLASLFFGILFTIILVVMVWFETRSVRTTFVTAITGILTTGIGVAVLRIIGFYA